MTAEQPIGFFDSGIGGLTVANAVLESLPNERIIYFGDSLHFPYGEKTADAIQSYSLKIAEYLLEKNCKCIVIACNSASASAYQYVKEFVGNHAIVIDVIDPTVYYINKYLPQIRNIGVIATRRTIQSEAYKNGLLRANPELNVASMATPLLAPMIEEGFINDEVSKSVINKYLSEEKLKDIESLILACTHYPFIKQEVEDFYDQKLSILDTPTVIAEFLKDVLGKRSLLNSTKQSLQAHEFYVSELNETILDTTKRFFAHKFHIEEKNIFAKVSQESGQ